MSQLVETVLFETVNKGNEKGRKSGISGRTSPVTKTRAEATLLEYQRDK
jgi:hypothetical protein